MIRKLKKKYILNIAVIHKRELPGFLSDFGINFLKNFYLASLDNPDIFSYVFEEKGRVIGIATGTIKSKDLIKAIIIRRLGQFFYIFLMYFLTHPLDIIKMVRLLSYPGLSRSQGELLTIAVDSQYHKKGVGRKLLTAIIGEFRKRGNSQFLVSVYDRLPANGFYKKMGFKYINSFNFLGEKMNYYEFYIK